MTTSEAGTPEGPQPAEAQRVFDQRRRQPSEDEACDDEGGLGRRGGQACRRRERQQRPVPEVKRIADQADGDWPSVASRREGNTMTSAVPATGSKARAPGKGLVPLSTIALPMMSETPDSDSRS